MPTRLRQHAHLEGLREAMLAFVRYADRAGLAAPVPTCPEWTVRDLVAHQGMVHRWAAANLRGPDPDPQTVEGFRREGLAEPDPLEWLADGAIDLAQAITDAPEDVEALVFLRDAPPARAFWARRQCHETTIHAVDALAAALGRMPRAEETWVRADLAADGIDELLSGFVTRPRSRLRSDTEQTLVVAPDDVPELWRVRTGPAPAVTDRLPAGAEVRADRELRGPAAELYLRLWNRTDPDPWWRERVTVHWV